MEPLVPLWEQRLRARQLHLPEWADDAPDRACVVATAHGVLQAHSFDVASGRLLLATDRPQGTTDATISPDGQWIWWFDDTDGDELGQWRRQPFGTPPGHGVETPIDLPAAYSAGLLLASDGSAVIGRSTDAGTFLHHLYVGRGASTSDGPLLIYRSEQDATAAALSHDGNLVAVEHAERGDNRHPALRVLQADTGRSVGDLDDGTGRGIYAVDFAPVDGDARLLVLHERHGTPALAMWDVAARSVRELTLRSGGQPLPGEVTDAAWYPGGDAILVAVDHEARTRLYRHELRSGVTTPVGPADGTVSDAAVRPDGEVWLRWSSSAHPRTVVAARSGREVVPVRGAQTPPSVPVTDIWADGPAGAVHALLRAPAGDGPWPVVLDLHGGPAAHRSDAFSPYLAAWVDHGFAVVSVNYRGSTGYGSAWRDALEGRVGLTELEDVAAVHDHLVAVGVADPERCVLAGASWGGYLTLLGLGTQPERWALGVAEVPVADYVAAYEDEMPDLQAFDRSLFGGSPRQLPEAYRRSSPITYVEAVRAPVLITAGENDPRCPLRQIERYVAALRARPDAAPVEFSTFGAGHGSLVDDEEVAQVRRQLKFVDAHLPGGLPDRP